MNLVEVKCLTTYGDYFPAGRMCSLVETEVNGDQRSVSMDRESIQRTPDLKCKMKFGPRTAKHRVQNTYTIRLRYTKVATNPLLAYPRPRYSSRQAERNTG